MKKILLATALFSMGAIAQEAPNFDELTVDTSKAATLEKRVAPTIEINGNLYQKAGAAYETDSVAFRAAASSVPGIASGDVVYSQSGNGAYRASGKIVLKVSDNANLAEIAAQHNATVEHSYGPFYVLQLNGNGDLNQVASALKASSKVESATVDLIDLGVEAH